jgi:aminoglycoside phosphotransferase (APT) family kinase protein
LTSSLPLSPRINVWIQSNIGSAAVIKSASKLKGSTSSDLFSMTLAEGATERQVVLRLFTNRNWLTHEPDLAVHEASALRAISQLDLPVPHLIAFDADGSRCGTPAVLMTHLPGRVNLQPVDFDQWLLEQAKVLRKLHTLTESDFHWVYFPYVKPMTAVIPKWSSISLKWLRAIRITQQPPPAGLTCFIHRDFHPTNLLWRGSTLTGVVDWVNACIGPADFDVAWMRINLLQMYGISAADRFLQHYSSLAQESQPFNPYWDLMALLEFTTNAPGIYPPWRQFGLTHLNNTIIRQRLEEHLLTVLSRFKQ